MKLAVNEMFISLDGEVNPWGQGTPTIFLRLQGCNMDCPYCDTKYAYHMPIDKHYVRTDSIMEKIKKIGCRRVTITGGEPLTQQEDLLSLITYLDAHGYQTTIETNGSIEIINEFSYARCGGQLSFIMDCKLHALDKMNLNNYFESRQHDWIKIIIGNKDDFNQAVKIMNFLKAHPTKPCQARFAFSPMAGQIEPAELAGWILENELYDVALNTQLHKTIWPDAATKHSEGQIIL